MAEFFIPTEDHVKMLIANPRPEEVDEVKASHDHTIEEAIRNALAVSDEAFAAVEGGRLLCITGVASAFLLSDTASPWLLNTMTAHSKQLLRYTRPVISRWRERYRVLEN